MRDGRGDDVRKVLATALVAAVGAALPVAARAAAPGSLTLTADHPAYMVGATPTYRIAGAPPDTPICWDSFVGQAGAPAERMTDPAPCNAQSTDTTGTWVGVGAPWAPPQAGEWMERAHVGGQVATITFTVGASLTLDHAAYVAGQRPIYTVHGAPPGACLVWKSWHNGVPTGEDNCYGQAADAAGNWTSPGTPFTSASAGKWIKEVTVGGETWMAGFTVYASSPDTSPSLVVDRSAYAVGDVPTVRLTGAPPNAPLVWTAVRDGIPVPAPMPADAKTTATGTWTGAGPAWSGDQVGTWREIVLVAGRPAGVTFAVGTAPATPAAAASVAAPYFWDGSGDGTADLDHGVETAASLGATAARLRYSSPECDSARPVPFDLVARAQDPDAVAAFANPAITTYVLTIVTCPKFAPSIGTNPWGSFDAWYLDPLQYGADGYAAVENAYAAFTRYLTATYPTKRFVLSNWEGDNAVYCGSATAFVGDPAFRAECGDNYPAHYPFAGGTGDTLRGLMLWFDARQAGVGDGRAGTAATVFDAPELNSTDFLHSRGLPSVLYDVLPALAVAPDSVSYSSYDATNLGPTETPQSNAVTCRLAAAVGAIRQVSGVQSVIVGEFGYDTSLSRIGPDGARTLTAEVLAEAAALGVPTASLWEANDGVFGLEALDGSGLRPLAAPFAGWMQTGTPPAASCP